MLFSQIKLGVPSIWIKTSDYSRTVESIIKFNDRSFYTIDPVKGYSKFVDKEWKSILVQMPDPTNPDSTRESLTFDFTVAYTHLLSEIKTSKEPATFLYSVYTKPDAMMEMFSGLISANNSQYRSAFWSDDLDQMPLQLLFLSSFDCPQDFSHLFYLTTFEEPNLDELATIVNHIDNSSGNIFVKPGTLPAIAKAAIGLTESDFINVCLNSVLESGTIDPDYIYNFKMADIKKNGILEIIRPKTTFDNIGGLDNIKDLITRNAVLWHNPDKALEFGISPIRRILMVGIPGTGKSAICEATANALGLDLARTGVSQVMNSYIGQSEANMRAVFKQINIMAPLCVWIDEFGRDMSGGSSSSHVDGGTTDRVHGEFLTGLQELPENVFLMCAANQLEHLKPEMLRADRFDKIMFVGLPSLSERIAILDIYLKDVKTDHVFDLEAIAQATQYFTGAEIKSLIKEVKFNVSSSQLRPIDSRDLINAAPKQRNILWNKNRQMIQDLYATALEQWDWASTEQFEDANLVLGNNSNTNATPKSAPKANAFKW